MRRVRAVRWLAAVLALGCGRANRDAPPPEPAPTPAVVVVAPPEAAPPAARPVLEVAPPPRAVVRPPAYYFPTAVGATWVYEERAFGVRTARYTEVVTGVRDGEAAKVVAVGRVGDDGTVTPVGEFAVSDGRLERLATPDFASVVVFEYRGQQSPADDFRVLRAALEQQRAARVGGERVADVPERERNTPMLPARVGDLPEEVSVPAGTFSALVVTPASSARPEAGADLFLRFSERAWYAPGVGLVRRECGPYVTVLVSFTPGRDERRGRTGSRRSAAVRRRTPT